MVSTDRRREEERREKEEGRGRGKEGKRRLRTERQDRSDSPSRTPGGGAVCIAQDPRSLGNENVAPTIPTKSSELHDRDRGKGIDDATERRRICELSMKLWQKKKIGMRGGAGDRSLRCG
jgi:hypothetical protein